MAGEQPPVSVSRAGGYATLIGVVLLLAATVLHPMEAEPNDSAAAFAEYAADAFWVATHLAQLAGTALITGGLLTLSWKLRAGRAGAWAVLAAAAAVAAFASTAMLQAVDGIALKSTVDRLASAPVESRAAAFEAAVAVRAIEVGLASIATMLFGLAVLLYGIALEVDGAAPKWLCVFGTAAGAATLASGVGMAYGGFSSTAMAVSMSSTVLAISWCVCVGVRLLRDSRV
jgi:hypothetical protein